MKSIHIRDVDDALIRRVKTLASLHHRSMQGELKAILEKATRKVPDNAEAEDLEIITVSTGNTGSWKRDDIYGDAR